MKPRKWFRLYTEWMTDPKVQMLPEKLQARHVKLMCLRAMGITPAPDSEVAYALRLRADRYATTKQALCKAGLLTTDNDLPTWCDRQPNTDNSGAERVAKCRAKAKADKCNVTANTTEKSREEKSREKEEKPPTPMRGFALKVTVAWNRLVESSKTAKGSLRAYRNSETMIKSIEKRAKNDKAFKEECIPLIEHLTKVGVRSWYLETHKGLGSFINTKCFPNACSGDWDKPDGEGAVVAGSKDDSPLGAAYVPYVKPDWERNE